MKNYLIVFALLLATVAVAQSVKLNKSAAVITADLKSKLIIASAQKWKAGNRDLGQKKGWLLSRIILSLGLQPGMPDGSLPDAVYRIPRIRLAQLLYRWRKNHRKLVLTIRLIPRCFDRSVDRRHRCVCRVRFGDSLHK